MDKLERGFKYLFLMFLCFFIGVLSAFVKIYNNQEDKNTGVNIENRYINYKNKNCYTKTDIELIVYGKIQ
jgi:uncharacterized membrane protein